MRKYSSWVLICIALILVIVYHGGSTLAQDGSQDNDQGRYFYQTGHYVSGDFLTQYDSVPNPEQIFGNPISSQFGTVDSLGEVYLVQYFERARFELHPDETGPLRVRITLIGERLSREVEEVTLPENFPACQYFPETDKKVCLAFLDFFNKNGGAALFGYPITNMVQENPYRSVQYFQRAKFEYHPERKNGEVVVLADIGREYFFLRDEDPRLLLAESPPPPVPGAFAPQPLLDLKVHAFTQDAIVSQNDSQTIYVLVYDQRMTPVENANVTLEITFPGGQTSRTIVPTTTDNYGLVEYAFTFEHAQIGEAEIIVRVSRDGVDGQTTTGFRIWW